MFEDIPEVSERYEQRLSYHTNELTQIAPLGPWCSISQRNGLNAPLLGSSTHLFLEGQLTRFPDVNQFLGRIHSLLPDDRYLAFHAITSENKKNILRRRYVSWGFKIYYLFYFLGRRVLPKLYGVRWVSKKLSIPIDMSKSEIMGRLIYNGFQIVEIRESSDNTLFIAQPDPAYEPNEARKDSNEGILFTMRRLGKNARPMTIYKFRSMHPYSEFVQAYLHRSNGLDAEGKFKNDFRVSTGGKFIRKYWIDEIPMIYNLLRGDIKLIGVRPISEHYFSLYPEEMRSMRSRHKPGLLPPFYADLPNSFEEIVESERRYLEAYEKAPLQTEVSYFFKILRNIFINKARSK
ncbi:hypothetical protein DYBT9275_02300 [Dyadobacter sp. CECT 9275]|uniref:Bacterial sugar transferase domain-containing protein n=1 Tax=Dyadobacter helix TaxID=2822344 RepID=A0A916NBR9_9BACT|nr:sugar transferase [Dyadobacter sp. CECT 9275]CAG4999765.1 hypothetical protein DYBT9275_02300 [Dyadobacter sp. CECT 9275]